MSSSSSVLHQELGPVALGDDMVITFPLTQADGAPWVPAPMSAHFRAKLHTDHTDQAAVIDETLGSGITITGSTATVRIAPDDQGELYATATLHWSLRIRTAADGEQTVAAGTLRVERLAVR